MTRSFALALAMLAVPSAAWACVGCVSSAFGDRTYGWPYLTLTMAPFLIGLSIAAGLASYYRARRGAVPADGAARPAPARRDPGPLDPNRRLLDKETT
jgi:hypothetical protein